MGSMPGAGVTHPSDPFASPIVGPTPFASTSPSTAPTTSTVCPKCGWHHPVEARSCAACGLIFARYAEAERRRQALAASAVPQPRHGDDVVPAQHPSHHAHPAGHELELDRGGYGMSAATASLLAPQVDDRPRAIAIGSVIGSAAAGAITASLALIAIQLTPFAIFAGVFFARSSLANGVAWLTAKLGPPGLLVLSVVTALVMVRIACGLVAAAVVAMDDAMETSEVRGVFWVLGEGWARGWRACGVLVVNALIVAALSTPVLYAVQSKMKGTALATVVVVVAAIAAFIMTRLCLALPLAVVGQRDVVDALGESWRTTSGSFIAMAVTLFLTGLISAAVAKLLMYSMVVPVVGIFVIFVGQALLAGFAIGILTGMFRQLVPPPARFT
jgi:hypothetical protein